MQNVETKEQLLDEELINQDLSKLSKEVTWEEIFKWKKRLPWENLDETYKDFDFSKIAKNWKFLPGVEKEDAIWKYIEIDGRKFYDSMTIASSDIEEPIFTYRISDATLQLNRQIWSFQIWKWVFYSFFDWSKTDYSFPYLVEELKNSTKYSAIKKYLKKMEGKEE